MEFFDQISYFSREIFWGVPISRVPWGGPEILGGSHQGPMGGSHRGSHVKITKVGGVQCSNPKSWGGPDPPNPCGGCAYDYIIIVVAPIHFECEEVQLNAA